MDRKGDWMITVSGRRFYPLDQREDDIDWGDVAHHLSRICRYGGAVADWYTVAEHCSLMCDWFLAKGEPENARYALLHDGSEYVFNDMIRPIKPLLGEYKKLETALGAMIFTKAGLRAQAPAAVKQADDLIIGDERQQLFTVEALARAGWAVKGTLGVTCRRWERDRARDEWMARFKAMFPKAAA